VHGSLKKFNETVNDMTDQVSSASTSSSNTRESNFINSVTPIILCGGSGTRLCPLSRQSLPKQFVPLIDNKSLMWLTLERTDLIGSEAHLFMMLDVLETSLIKSCTVILEPIARNNADAMALGALQVLKAHAGSAVSAAAQNSA
jgi:mannose-1-phosphate guanylyltransferase